jgi:Na+/proline symporter
MWLTCAVIGGPVGLILVGTRLALLAEIREIYTLPDVVEARYGGSWPRAAMALALLVGVVGYLGTQVLALGVALGAMFDLNLAASMTIGLAVVASYSVAGGMLAAVYTDLLQGALMLAAAFAICFYALEAAGGLTEMTTTLQAMDPEYLSAWGTMGPLAAVSWHFLAVLGISGQPHVITKYLMLRDVRSMRWAQALSISTFLPVTFIWVGVGLAMRYLVQTGAEPALESPDLATPMFLLHHTPPVVAGIALAGLLGRGGSAGHP